MKSLKWRSSRCSKSRPAKQSRCWTCVRLRLAGQGTEAERQKRLLALASERVADAPNQLKQAEADALAAADGSDLVNIGFAYSGLGQRRVSR